jgi:branched-chain amino acid transport system substrate-binding protein
MVSACTIGPVGQRHQIGTLTIGADLPLSGDDAVDGAPVQNGISLALSDRGSVCGAASHSDACLTLRLRLLDDVVKGIHDPTMGRSNVRLLAGDPAVVGMVGPLYDSVAKAEIPVANAAGLAIVSPANTDACLTQEPADGQCQGLARSLRPHDTNTYFRVVTTQLSEGAAAADLAYRSLAKRRAFVVKDASPQAPALATAFSARFIRDGGRFVEQVSADVIYFAGSDLTVGAGLRKQMAGTSPQIPLIGSDALATDQFAKAAGAGARGSYYTLVGPDPASTRSAAAFVRQYRKRFGREPNTASLAAFDATGVLIDAIARAIDDTGGNQPNRAEVLSELAKTSAYAGAMGSFGFDALGDTTLRWVAAYQWLAPTDPAGRFMAEFTVG